MEKNEGVYRDIRVLDLSTEMGWFCGKLLADVGAQVVKIEPVGGDPGRHKGPFYKDEPGAEHSLNWWFNNKGKQSVTLNLESADGRQVLRQLLDDTDVLIESFEPGYMDGLGLSYAALEQSYPELIYASISAFGQTGPYAGFKGPDPVISALGGMTYLTGNPGQPPVRISSNQYYLTGSAEASTHVLAALRHRKKTGEGQHIDVSCQLTAVRCLMNATQYPLLEGFDMTRQGIYLAVTPEYPVQAMFACKDGYVYTTLRGGVQGTAAMLSLLDWMGPHIDIPDEIQQTDWMTYDPVALAQKPEMALRFIAVTELLVEFFPKFTKTEIYEESVRRGIMLAQISTTADIAADTQLEARHYFDPVSHDDSGIYDYASRWVHMSESPLLNTHRAPKIGEHNEQVYTDSAGLSQTALNQLYQAGVI